MLPSLPPIANSQLKTNYLVILIWILLTCNFKHLLAIKSSCH